MVKHNILVTALLTICMAAPVKAETIINLGVSDDDGPGIAIITSPRRYRDYHRQYRYDWLDYQGYRGYHPHYRHGWRNYQGYRGYHRSYRHGRRYYPRRSSFQIRIGF